MDKVDCFFAIALVICFVMMVVTRHAEGDRETVRISVQSQKVSPSSACGRAEFKLYEPNYETGSGEWVKK